MAQSNTRSFVPASGLVLLAAAALAVSNRTLAGSMARAAGHMTEHAGEPAMLLLSGSALIAIAGAVRRFRV